MRLVAILSMLLACLASAAGAAERVALVVGSPSYQGSSLLVNARANAELIGGTLRAMGYEVEQLIDPDRAEFVRAIRSIEDRLSATPNAVFLFYYSGYAIVLNAQDYLLLRDASTASQMDVEDSAISLDRIVSRRQAGATTILFVDAIAVKPLEDGTRSVNRGLARVSDVPSGVVVSMAMEPGTVAVDGNGPSSVYTSALARALPASADVDAVLRNIRDEVIDVTAGRQAPWSEGNLDKPIALASTIARPEGSPSQEVEDWQNIQDSADKELLAAFLKKHEGDPVYDVLRKRLAELEAAQAAEAAPGSRPPPPPDEQGAILERHPTIDAPDTVVAGEVITVSVALTEDLQTPEVQARAAPGETLGEDGSLRLALPGGSDEWPIDFDFFAPGFDLADGGEWGQRIVLQRNSDSDVARFEIRARGIEQPELARRLTVRFYHEGTFLGSAMRPVKVLSEQPAHAAGLLATTTIPPSDKTLTGELLIGDRIDVPDLDVTILYDDPDKLGPARISIHSPHIGAPLYDTFSTPPEMADWLQQEYGRLVSLGRKVRGATSLTAEPTGSAKQQAEFAARGLGEALYRNYVPEAFKAEFWRLKDRGQLKSIQITSNSTMFPWELVRATSPDGRTKDDFLGVAYRMARWAPRTIASQADAPLDTMAFTGVAAVAPAYTGDLSLPFQQVEIEALKKLAGFKQFGGDFVSFERLLGEVSGGFVHFSGHGEINPPGAGRPTFAIRLLDASLDPSMWSALNASVVHKGSPFYFFNACETGQSNALGGFVQGWGPAVLESGASGFIGGMWPLTDKTAAAVSTGFYGDIAKGLPAGPVYVGDVLRDMRRRFYETGDPTYLAYTFYGNANLQITAQ